MMTGWRGCADRHSDPPPPGDDDLDQYRIPQGSLFLELYCTRNHATNPRYPDATNTSFPRELYDNNGLLDLGRLAPADASGFRAPVWRVVISEALMTTTVCWNDPNAVAGRNRTAHHSIRSCNSIRCSDPPTASSFNLDLISALRGSTPDATDRLVPERYVWFTPQPPPETPDGYATFYCRNPDPVTGVKLAPGSYAVVGPRMLTRIGASDDNDSTTIRDQSPQRILMAGTTFDMFDNNGNDSYLPLLGPPKLIRTPVLGIICAAYPPNTAPVIWSNPALTSPGIGLSVSEPLPQENTIKSQGPRLYMIRTSACLTVTMTPIRRGGRHQAASRTNRSTTKRGVLCAF